MSGCKIVTLADEAGFRTMAQLFTPALQARQILDSDGDWFEPMVSFVDLPDDAGERLLNRLSPAFRFQEEPAAFAPATFAESIAEGDEMTLLPRGFTLVQGIRRMNVSLIGLADWDGDGKYDWLVRCSVRSVDDTAGALGEVERDYYLAITDPLAPIIRPQVIGVYDCQGGNCAVYDNMRDYPPETAVVELLAGQRTVLSPPAEPGKKGEADALREKKLKN